MPSMGTVSLVHSPVEPQGLSYTAGPLQAQGPLAHGRRGAVGGSWTRTRSGLSSVSTTRRCGRPRKVSGAMLVM